MVFKEKNVPWNKNKNLSKEHIRKIVNTRIKNNSYIRNEETRNKARKTMKEKKRNVGSKNNMWKGDNVKFGALHSWVKRHKPKLNFCEKCKKHSQLELSNISGKYKRDINDFKWLCRRCHIYEDNRIKNLKQYGGDKNSKM